MTTTKNDGDDLAHQQVDAFLRILNERIGADESTIQTIITKQQKNGKVYVTWGVVLTVLGVLTTYLVNDKVQRIEADLMHTKELQRDVRERLGVVETRVRDLKECK
jgi:hypothetical protein